jgi:hypothetical protein
VVVLEPWKVGLKQPGFRLRAALTIITLAALLAALVHFLRWNEARPGVVLSDPLLGMFRPVDVTWLIFCLVYGGLCAAIVLLAREPEHLLLAMQGYAVLTVFRVLALWLVPLEPPSAMIPLRDPFVEFFGGMASPLNKDLFFSGHTSTLFLLFLNASGRLARRLFFCGTLAVAVCLLIQHAHYSIDVLVAFPFAYAAHRIVSRLNAAFV